MKLNKVTRILAVAALILSFSLLLSLLWGRLGVFSPTSADPYPREKVEEICDRVLQRQVIPADLLRYINDEDLVSSLLEYNTETATLKSNYGRFGAEIAHALYYEHNPDPGDYLRPDRFYEMADRISTLALYKNCEELCGTDPILSYCLSKEAGGSYGIWAGRLHQPDYVGEDLAAQTEAYFARIDRLLDRLDQDRLGLS